MANKKLLERATELGLEDVDGLSDKELVDRINEAQNNQPDPEPADEPEAPEEPENPEPEEPASNIMTTENEFGDEDLPPVRERELSEKDKKQIIKMFNAPNASVQAIADHFSVEPEAVFAVVDAHNNGGSEDE